MAKCKLNFNLGNFELLDFYLVKASFKRWNEIPPFFFFATAASASSASANLFRVSERKTSRFFVSRLQCPASILLIASLNDWIASNGLELVMKHRPLRSYSLKVSSGGYPNLGSWNFKWRIFFGLRKEKLLPLFYVPFTAFWHTWIHGLYGD